MFIKFDHVKPSLVHDSFHIQNIEMIPLVQFKDVIFFDVYKRCENMSQKMWYYLTQESFVDYMYCRNPTLAKCGGEAQHLEKVRIWSPLGLPNV